MGASSAFFYAYVHGYKKNIYICCACKIISLLHLTYPISHFLPRCIPCIIMPADLCLIYSLQNKIIS